MEDKTFSELLEDLKVVFEEKLAAYLIRDFDAALKCIERERQIEAELGHRAGPPATEPL